MNAGIKGEVYRASRSGFGQAGLGTLNEVQAPASSAITSEVFVVKSVSPLHTKKHFAWLRPGCAGRAKYHSESPLWFWDRAFAAQGTNGSSGPETTPE